MENKLHRVVLPFFVYAAFAFLVAIVLITLNTTSFFGFHFEPKLLAITHVFALGWATMMIVGACYQLIPFLNRVPLYSYSLAYCSFVLLAIGIPMIVFSFVFFDFNMISLIGGAMINCAFLCFIYTIWKTVNKQREINIHSVYIIVSSIWLVLTAFVGLLILLNFNYSFLSKESIYYLSFHAHIGFVGWFLLLIIGVSSRLFPMFLMSEYNNEPLLKLILWVVNIALISYLAIFLFFNELNLHVIPIVCISAAVFAYLYYCFNVFTTRFKKKKGHMLNLSTVSVLFLLISLGNISLLFFVKPDSYSSQFILTYGSFIFLGWITSLIFGMTFKIVPYVIWTMFKSEQKQHIPILPVDLFSKNLVHIMNAIYLFGIGLFILGIMLSENVVMKYSCGLLLVAAILYNYNVLKMFFYKPTYYETNE
jgi:hypothetical protein